MYEELNNKNGIIHHTQTDRAVQPKDELLRTAHFGLGSYLTVLIPPARR